MIAYDFTTTDATPLVIWEKVLAASASMTIHVDVEGVQTDGTHVVAGVCAGTFIRGAAGAPTLVNTADGDFVGTNTFSPTNTRPKVTFDVSGNSCRAVWTGKAATTVRVKTKTQIHLNES